MHVLFVSRRYFPTISGMSVYALNLVRGLVSTGHEVTMLSQFRGDPEGVGIYGGGPPPDISGATVIGLESVGEVSGDFERDIDLIVEAAAEQHARKPLDIIHAQYGYPPGLAALRCSRRLGIPNVVSIQGGDGHWVGTCCHYHRSVMQTVLRHAGAVLIGSRSFLEDVARKNRIPPEAFTVIPGAVDVSRFTPSKESGEVGERDPILLFHGRMDARKGVFDLLRAAEMLGSRPFRLVFSGIGPDSSRLAEAVASSPISHRIELRGYVDYWSAPDVYRAADIFVSPTYSEGFSNTILEAMATGLPIVTTAAVGVIDCIRDGENGLIVPVRDASSLAGAVARLLDDPQLARRLGAAALAEVGERYTWNNVTSRIATVYRSLLGTRPDDSWSIHAEIDECPLRRSPHLL
jgi:glycogen(starch) synthase